LEEQPLQAYALPQREERGDRREEKERNESRVAGKGSINTKVERRSIRSAIVPEIRSRRAERGDELSVITAN
jgi:hypothetical protein